VDARLVSAAIALGALVATTASAAALVLAEAERFERLGGWVLDQQFMDEMGSPYLLAHGLGVPVADAATRVRFPAAGRYRVFVRTRDWVPPHGPGRFQVLVGGKPLAATFGAAGGGQWAWQDGGEADVAEGDAALAVHDLTGFEGRCDAVLFVKDAPPDFAPPNERDALAALRRRALGLPDEPRPAGEFDFVVVGGGFAGTCAAVAAARLGLRVALVQDRFVLGGCASGEVRVSPIGKLDLPPFPHNSDIVKELLHPDRQRVDTDLAATEERRLAVVRRERNITLFLGHRAVAVRKEGDRIATVIATNVRTGEELAFRAPLFADCTGDGSLGFLAGADSRMGREGRDETGEPLAPEQADRMVLGATNKWYAVREDQPSPFPACPWALRVTEESVEVSPPKYPEGYGPRGMVVCAAWNWESGFSRDMVREAERVRDHNLRAIYGTWDFLKNRSRDKAKYAHWRLEWVAHVLGKRESRRLLGDLILTEHDLHGPKRTVYPDGCVTATWYFDLHYPHPDNTRHFPGQEYRSIAYDDPNFARLRGDIPGSETRLEPYPIPFRCLYSRNVPNLLMAGRNISVTHVALAPVRVMNTTGQMGTVVGRAAALCHRRGCMPRAVYERHLDDLKRLLGDPGRQ